MSAGTAAARPLAIPGLPVLGWRSVRLAGAPQADTACVLDHPRLHFTTSGRASIMLALAALRLPLGSQVLVPTYHCPTMVAPLAPLGLLPRFFPITPGGGPDLAWLAGQDMTGVGAILVPHYFGLPQPMAALRRWCDAHRLALVEDCAHAMFGMSDGRPIGQWGDAAIASLTKFIPVTEGGCLLLNRADLQAPALQAPSTASAFKAAFDIVDLAVRHRRLPGLNTVLAGAIAGMRALRGRDAAASPATPIDPLQVDTPDAAGYTIDTDRAQQGLGAVARVVARHTNRSVNIAGRRHNFERLLALLPADAAMRPLVDSLPAGCAPYVFPLWVRQPDPAYGRLKAAGVPLFRWNWQWPDVPDLPGDQGKLWAHHVVQLPCHQDLQPAQLQAIADTVRDAFGRRG